MRRIPSSRRTGILLRQVRDLSRAALEAELAAAGHELTFSQYITQKKLAMGCSSPGELARAFACPIEFGQARIAAFNGRNNPDNFI